MNQIIHEIDFLGGAGYEIVKPPIEFKDLVIESVFDQDATRLTTNILTWAGDVAERMNNFFDGGIDGTTVGIFEALPYRVSLVCSGVTFTLFEAGINLASKDAEFTCDIVKAPIRETGKIDFLTARADSFRFAVLAGLPVGTPGRITSADYLDIWYMKGKYPENMEILITSSTIFMILKEGYESIKRLSDIAAAVAGGLTGFIEAFLMTIALVFYLILLMVAMATMTSKLVEEIFPWVYFHRGMYVRTLMQKGCEFLGLGFSSTIFSPGSPYYNQYIIPPKNNIQGSIVGAISTQTGYYDGTFGQLIRDLMAEYCGEVKIIGTTLHFEIEGYFENLSTYKVPEVKTLVPYGTNAEETPANYTIEYLNDKVDLYNYDNTNGVRLQVYSEPVTVINKKNIVLEGLREVIIPFTLPNVKTTISAVEIEMGLIWDAIASFLGVAASLITGSPIGSEPTIPVGGSYNVLKLDTHFISEHKTGIYLGGGKTDPNSSTTLGVANLLQHFHYVRIPKPIYSGSGNQWYYYKGTVPLCCEDYLAIKDNNYGTFKGYPVKLLSVQWRPYEEIADISFMVNKPFTNNLQARIVEPGKPQIIL